MAGRGIGPGRYHRIPSLSTSLIPSTGLGQSASPDLPYNFCNSEKKMTSQLDAYRVLTRVLGATSSERRGSCVTYCLSRLADISFNPLALGEGDVQCAPPGAFVDVVVVTQQRPDRVSSFLSVVVGDSPVSGRPR